MINGNIAYKVESSSDNIDLEELENLIYHYEEKNRKIFRVNSALDRKLVSFQANKKSPIYRLFKYKEGFSASLISYLLDSLKIKKGPVLDPFSGTGTTSIVCSQHGLSSVGIELLPIGSLVADVRCKLTGKLSKSVINKLKLWKTDRPWEKEKSYNQIPHIRITNGAYPQKTEDSIAKCLHAIQKETPLLKKILLFVLCSILEEVSYTRKDGQYLRWDHRANRKNGSSTFNKGLIHNFNSAFDKKLGEIISDAENFELYAPEDLFSFCENKKNPGKASFIKGSCLDEMILQKSNSYEAIITSPPYCNRYDYTRTYALELALLGIGEKEIVNLRQTMLSCTVENKTKDLLNINKKWNDVLEYLTSHEILQSVNKYLEHQKNIGALNNNGIPRMVDGYFKELACIIHESARVLKKNGLFAMVNDNVRYAGVCIPVDLILSDIANFCGMETVEIMLLPSGKGNSSQQMGAHGRTALRKCVYVWRKK